MKFLAALVLAAVAFALPAEESADAVAKRENCYVGAEPDPYVVATVYKVGLQRKLDSTLMLALFETGLVESNMHNLDCGDKDSIGVFQQRPSMGVWGTYGQIKNVEHAANAFIDALSACGDRHPGWPAGSLAQCAQVSEIPDAYNRMHDRASDLLKETIDKFGGNSVSIPGVGAVNAGSNPHKSSSSSHAAAAAKPKPKPEVVPKKCKTHRTAKKGDNCAKMAGKAGISVRKFMALNRGAIDSGCRQMRAGAKYCVA